MTLDTSKKILIVGLGLIGGSYARALTEKGFEVGAIDSDPSAVAYAESEGFIGGGESVVLPDYVARFDVVVFALYPHIFIDWIRDNQSCLKSGALLTDVTGVKCTVVYKVQSMLRDDLEFIGAHPMAGREVSGVKNSDASIFRGANYIVTPTEKNSFEAIEQCKSLGLALGFEKISVLTPEKHDEMIGFLSQLTHVIAVSLMVSRESRHLADYTGDSFRDLTRIADINDVMWSELFLLNKTRLLESMDLFEKKFAEMRTCIENDDVEAMRAMMKESTERRKFFN